MIQRKDDEFSLSGLERHTEEIFPYFSSDKPCGELVLGKDCIKIISDKSNSLGVFL